MILPVAKVYNAKQFYWIAILYRKKGRKNTLGLGAYERAPKGHCPKKYFFHKRSFPTKYWHFESRER
jgi:hypothetical protein